MWFKKTLQTADSWGMLPIRLGLGVIFLAHGAQKLFGFFGGPGLSGFSEFIGGQLGMQPGILWGTLAACSEFFGGLFVLVGILTRWASIPIIFVMVVAVVTVHGKNGFFLQNQGIEYNLALTGMAVALLIGGGGKLSADRAIAFKG